MLPSVPQAVDAAGPVFALALGLLVWMFVLGTPVLFALAIRFLWYRHVYVGRSAELEKLIWQLHRIASAMEATSAPQSQPANQEEPSKARPVALSMFGR